jgi:hypothetical protein
MAAAGAGVLFGIAFTFKYNAALFAVAGVLTLWLRRRLTLPDVGRMAAGFCAPVLALVALFAVSATLRPLVDATLLYNLQYSAETYGLVSPARYLVSFPLERARVDALWTLGGAGCILLLVGALGRRERLMPVVWVAAACLSIAINGSRSLPQYFIQANPPLALAAAWGGVIAWHWMKDAFGRRAQYAGMAVALIVVVGVWRVVDAQLPKLVDQTVFDARYAFGAMPREVYLARFDDDRKYSALDAAALGGYLRAHSAPSERVFVFGFTSGAYLEAHRASASRFFWSRPVIAGFKSGTAGYGADGLLSDLDLNRPAVIALQQKDWAPDVDDSAAFFMRSPRLAGWLQAHYVRAAGPDVPAGFDLWLRRAAP